MDPEDEEEHVEPGEGNSLVARDGDVDAHEEDVDGPGDGELL